MSDFNTKATVSLNINGQQAQQTLNQLRTNALNLETAVAKAAAAGDKVSLKRLRKELLDTKKDIRDMESSTMQVENVLRNLDKATPRELNKTLQNLNRQLQYVERGSKAWEEHTAKIRIVKDELTKVNSELRTQESFWERFNRKLNDWQTSIMGAIAAITGLIMAGRSAVSAFADMDAEMANVRKFTGMEADEVKELNEEFKKIDTRTSREELNKLAQEAGRLGKSSQEDVLGFVRAADQINVALDDLGDGATLVLSKLGTIFGDEKRLGTEKALLSIGSVINELSQNCTASAPYLAQFAQRMAGVGAQADMTIPQIMGFAAVLDSQGQAVEMSATALSKLIMDMFKQQDKIVKATGLNADKFNEALKRSTNEGLLMLIERLHDLGNIDVLAPVFKDMGENGARAAQVISALAGNLEMVKWEQEEATKAFEEGTSVTKEFNVQNNTVQAGLDKARKRVTELAVELGEKLMPVMRHVYSSTTFMMKALSTIISFISEYKGEILSAVAAVTTYVVVAKADLAIEKARLAYKKLLVIWNERLVTGTRTLFATLRANPYAAIASAIVALIGLYTSWVMKSKQLADSQKMIKDIEEEASHIHSDEINRISALNKIIHDNSKSLAQRQNAINEMQKLVPDYHASLTKEGNLYNENAAAVEAYCKRLQLAAQIQAASAKLTDAESKKRNFQQNTPKNLTNAYFEENVNGLSEGEAAGKAHASVGAYRAWKVESEKISAEVDSLKKYVENKTAEMAKIEPVKVSTQDSDSDSSGGDDGGTGKAEDRFKAEKEWKQREEALNRIAYAKGEKDFLAYSDRMLEIEVEFNKRKLEHTDLTETERLQIETEYYEALKKISDAAQKKTIDDENASYAEQLAQLKQRFIDGLSSYEVYQEASEQLEMTHLKTLASLYEEGSKDQLQAQKSLQDKLVANQRKHQKELEDAEKKHQDALAKMKEKYFGDNPQERQAKYAADLALLTEVYNAEIKAAGDNAKEKLRIEEAFQKAKLALMEQYNIEGAEQNKNFLQEWNDDVLDFLESDLGKAVSGAVDTLVSGMSSIFQQLTTIVQAELEIQQAAIDRRYDAEVSLAEGNNYKINKLEKQRQAELAKAKKEANKKMFAMQVIQAVAQTAQAAINAYSSAAAIPVVGWVMGPVAAAMAVAAGALQIAAIKKQQQASEAQGYAEGGFTPKGDKYKEVGVVHAGEWVASQELVNSPVTRPILNALDYAQKTNSIGSLSMEDVSRTITAPVRAASHSATNTSRFSEDKKDDNTSRNLPDGKVLEVLESLTDRLNEPFITVNTVTGDTGIQKAQDEYERLMKNKSPKSKK